MNSTATPCTTTATSTTTNSSNNNTSEQYHAVLLAIYSVVLLIGTISLSLMMHIMKSSTTSFTSIAVLNLIFTHFIFLLTVPFRIYYYTSHSWKLNHDLCKVISAMIHVHMYMSFIFYVIILITRLMTFYCKAEQVSIQKVHALLGSAVVWTMVLIITPCVINFYYGNDEEGHNNNTQGEKYCFQFGKNITSPIQVLNHIISTLIIVVAILLTALQANVLRVLYRKHRKGCTSQQDFGAQLKSLCFALIMVICFIPYHLFRYYYVKDIENMQNLNEVFLSLTTFNCLDMLTFMGRRTCSRCFPGKIV